MHGRGNRNITALSSGFHADVHLGTNSGTDGGDAPMRDGFTAHDNTAGNRLRPIGTFLSSAGITAGGGTSLCPVTR